MQKRIFLVLTVGSLIFFLTTLLSCSANRKLNSGPTNYSEEKFGWKLGTQCYTFKNYTFFETLAKADSCNLKYVEGFPRQKIGLDTQRTMNFDMSRGTMLLVKKMLADNGISILAYGVVRAKGLEEWKKVFEFCKFMGIQTIVCEPEKNDLNMLSAFCDQYQIDAAFHNHPSPSAYWHPDSVLAAIKGYSKRMGACADIGHWVRSGLDPVECMRKLNGNIKHFHFKDISQVENKKESEVIWGKGLCNIPAVIHEMKAQGFRGMISVEYEYNLSNNVEYARQSVEYLRNELKKR